MIIVWPVLIRTLKPYPYMRIFVLCLRKRVTNVVSIFFAFILSVSGFLRAYNVTNTLARIPLKIKAVVNYLMSAFFVVPVWALSKQTNKQTKNFSPYTSNLFLLKSSIIMKTILLSLGKSLTNI